MNKIYRNTKMEKKAHLRVRGKSESRNNILHVGKKKTKPNRK